jgi:hypothetical protein
MPKVKVTIEEHLSKTVEIEVSQEVFDDRNTDVVISKVIDMYANGEIVLTADDFNGTKLIAITDEEFGETEWDEF